MNTCMALVLGAFLALGAHAQELETSPSSEALLNQSDARAQALIEPHLGQASAQEEANSDCFDESASAATPDEARRTAKLAIVKDIALAIGGLQLKTVTESFQSDDSKNINLDGTKEIQEKKKMGDDGVFSYGGFDLPPIRFPEVALSQSSSMAEDGQASQSFSVAVVKGCISHAGLRHAQFDHALSKLREVQRVAAEPGWEDAQIDAVRELRMKFLSFRAQFDEPGFIEDLALFERNEIKPLERGLADYSRITAGRYRVFIEAPPSVAIPLEQFILSQSSNAQISVLFSTTLETSRIARRVHPVLGALTRDARDAVPESPPNSSTYLTLAEYTM